MKKLLTFTVFTLAFCSCKKQDGERRDWACKCDNGQTYTIQDASAANATNLCDQYDNICPPGVQCVTSWDCNLD